jgi:hypothetical protein
MTDQTSPLSTEVASSGSTSSASVDTSTSSSSHTDTSHVESGSNKTNEAPAKKRSLVDIVNEKYDELAASKSEDAAKPDDKTTGVRKVEASKTPAAPKQDAVVAPKKEVDPITGRELEAVKVPQSTPGVLREDWDKLPRSWQEYISKRELDMRQNLTRLGESDKFAKEVRAHAKDLMPLLKERNVDFNAFIKDSFQTAYNLGAGNPQQRAAVIANMIRIWQPDPKALQAILGGKAQPPAAPRPPVDFEAEVNKRLEARQKDELGKTTKSVVDTFYDDPKNEFARELDSQIGAAITGGFVHMTNPDGTPKAPAQTVKEAYEFALKNSEQHQALLARRAGTTQGVTNTNNPNAGKEPVRQAAPSPGGGRPVKQPVKKFGKNVNAAAEDAWEQVMSRKK